MALIGARGLVVGGGSGGGAGASNPYEAIAGLNSLWPADSPHIVQGPSGVVAVQTRSSIVRVEALYQPVAAQAPTIAGLNAGRLAWNFAAASSQFLMATSPLEDIVDDDGAFAVFATIKTASNVPQAPIYGRAYATSRWTLLLDPGGSGKVQFSVIGGTTASILSNASVADGLPHRIIGIYDPAQDPGPTLSLWVDALLQTDNADVVGPLAASGDRVALGAQVSNAGASVVFFDGLIGDPGSYGVPLRGADVTRLDTIMRGRFSL